MNWTASYLLSSLFISCLGMGYFLYGKKEQRLWPMVAGIVLGIFPYLVSNVWLMWGIAVAIMAGVWILREQ